MARPKIPQKTETELLLKCRRRCCVCYGLHRDNRIVQGQIAHLDHNPSNNDLTNLAFVCFAHHDQYDSQTSQSKKLTLEEVKAFKQELEDHIQDAWNRPIIDTDLITVDIFSGKYETGNEFASASLAVKYLGGGLIQVSGFALYGKTREFGPNIGELDFITEVQRNKAVYIDQLHDKQYKLELTFLGSKLLAAEDYVIGYFGHNARFEGTYYCQK